MAPFIRCLMYALANGRRDNTGQNCLEGGSSIRFWRFSLGVSGTRGSWVCHDRLL